MTKDNRSFKRISYRIKSEIHSKNYVTYSTSGNISTGGIFIHTPDPLAIGSTLELIINLPNLKEQTILGEVRWILENNNEKSRAGMGIKFVNISEKQIAKIQDLILANQ